MNWKFWQKGKQRENSAGIAAVQLSKPKELPYPVGIYLVTKLKLDPDWVWNLKCVMRPKADEKKVFEIRMFSPATTAGKGVVVSNYHSLDEHPDLILFFGSFNKRTGSVELEEKLEKVA